MNVLHPEPPNHVKSVIPGRGLHWAALFAAALTWPLLISGGEVTTYKVGMAVPDWPTTFNENMFLYDFWNASYGVFKEHLHRLFGATLGLMAIVLAVWAYCTDPRRWMKAVGIGALLAVCLQGVLGGLRVTRNSTSLASFHACTGQAVFALLVAVAVWTGPRWWNAAKPVPDDGQIRRASSFVLGLIYLQIVLGAWVRHFPSAVSAIAHLCSAFCVLAGVFRLNWRIERNRETYSSLVGAARMMGAILLIQMTLGLLAFWILLPFDGTVSPVQTAQAMIRTGHQANGALLLATGVVLALRAIRGFDPATTIYKELNEAKETRSELEAIF